MYLMYLNREAKGSQYGRIWSSYSPYGMFHPGKYLSECVLLIPGTSNE